MGSRNRSGGVRNIVWGGGRVHLAVVLLLGACTARAQEMPKSQPPLWSAKPDIAAFESIEKERLAAGQRAIDALVAVNGARTIENTLGPYDDAIRQLNTAQNLAAFMQQVHPDAAFRDSATAMTTQVSSAQTALALNRKVYQALAGLDVSKADSATRYYVQRTLLEFRLAGVDKDDTTRDKIHKLSDQLTEEASMFDRNISDDRKIVEVGNASELDGLPQDYIDSHKPGADGKIQIIADETDAYPVLQFAKSADLRRRFWEAFRSRAYPKNQQVLLEMMQTRYQIATTLGYSSWADYNAADKMIRNGGNIAKFISDLDDATRPLAKREFEMFLAEKRKSDPGATEVFGYETARLSELIRRQRYDFDSQSVRPYLPYNEVKQGILDTASTLFHVSFRQEMNAPAWDPLVETWDVIENGKAIGRMYLDMHPRPGKYGHAEMVPLLDGIRGKQLPEAALVCNFPVPTASDPGLLAYNEAETFFHEFGHMMHHILGGRQQWAGISGITMESDFVEAPSQMLEEWMRSPQVLASFAKQYKTGEPIPAELVARMNRAAAFGRATFIAQQNAYSAISYELYKDDPAKIDLNAVPMEAVRRYTPFTPLPSDYEMDASFNHLANYSSAYYTYMWDKVIAEDFFQQFDQRNLLAGDTPMRYRRLVLEPGGSESANDLVKNFLGRAQNMDALKKWMAEEFEAPGGGKNSGGH